jgi:Xaa-Pro dipeptidase
MVVTVEPGIYFSVYALQHFYLPSPIHSKYINTEVLGRYMPVGGVRIEDDILITSSGFENLTTAPKGDAMLETIRHGKNSVVDLRSSNSAPLRRLSDHIEPTLRRAPGISGKTPPQHLQKPLARAATLPAEFSQQRNMDLEPFIGPSLCSNFSRSMTTEEKIQQWQHKRSPAKAKKLNPICGEMDTNFQHIYMSNASSLATLSQSALEFQSIPTCRNCAILIQTLDRLRQNLRSSVQSPSKPEVKRILETDSRSKNAERVCGKASSIPQSVDELSVGASACTVNLERHQRVALPPPEPATDNTTETRAARWACNYGTAPRTLPIRPQTLDRQLPQALPRGEGSTANSNPISSHPLITTATPLPPQPRRPSHEKLAKPLPSAKALEVEATRQKLESLQLRLDSLEKGARAKIRHHDQAMLPERFLSSRPSMPVLMSQNPWQQHNVRSRPTDRRGPICRRSTNLEGLDIERARLQRLEDSERQRRLERDALTRDTFFLR